MILRLFSGISEFRADLLRSVFHHHLSPPKSRPPSFNFTVTTQQDIHLLARILDTAKMPAYRPNPFFATTHTFFLPSVGDRVDSAIDEAKHLAADAQAKANQLYGKADLKIQDAKEATEVAIKGAPTGVDLYSR